MTTRAAAIGSFFQIRDHPGSAASTSVSTRLDVGSTASCVWEDFLHHFKIFKTSKRKFPHFMILSPQVRFFFSDPKVMTNASRNYALLIKLHMTKYFIHSHDSCADLTDLTRTTALVATSALLVSMGHFLDQFHRFFIHHCSSLHGFFPQFSFQSCS